MSVAALPRQVNPLLLANRGQSLRGSLPVKNFPRLAEAVVDLRGPIVAELEFVLTRPGRCRIQGRVQAPVALTCQRCLQSMDWDLVSDFAWTPVTDVFSRDAAGGETAEAEPVELEDGQLDVIVALEDELLLALPAAPLHEDTNCAAGLKKEFTAAELQAGQKRSDNPFAVLQALKGQDKGKN
ncbi:uncharacterized protein SAMN05216526_0132 [Ectothiorhodosinus mongolicus]|uniref:Large ribosomal RNA subunit accumulation protein YceD n=1 Tax=Ectothiorhodosinus mongolicus TaxID=233100 RepID=A0A1R3VRC6_9GAMM|nr:YceD family protein [Ectothiorhodosinus mongolicus]ULX57814.1 hypothetical protein CKX93_09230 [Ectothiorhodosinus mongolicus]SIT65682.1 uncharacterized protein SAMN05216526_0132 [Ectothiorhodosinus mongolicus]